MFHGNIELWENISRKFFQNFDSTAERRNYTGCTATFFYFEHPNVEQNKVYPKNQRRDSQITCVSFRVKYKNSIKLSSNHFCK